MRSEQMTFRKTAIWPVARMKCSWQGRGWLAREGLRDGAAGDGGSPLNVLGFFLDCWLSFYSSRTLWNHLLTALGCSKNAMIYFLETFNNSKNYFPMKFGVQGKSLKFRIILAYWIYLSSRLSTTFWDNDLRINTLQVRFRWHCHCQGWVDGLGDQYWRDDG